MDTKIIRGSDSCHEQIINSIEPILSFSGDAIYDEWKSKISDKFLALLGDLPTTRCPLNIDIKHDIAREGYREISFTFDSEEQCAVPCFLVIPDNVKKPCPAVICLQGHSTGAHISMGIAKFPGDEKSFPRAAHALWAVRNGFAALVIEQRAMGVRRSKQTADSCLFDAMAALLLGRTTIGERVFDVSRGIDALASFSEIDTDKIVCMGNSGGGTATYYAACYDNRIKIAVPSCAFSSYKDSIGSIYHCTCNYIPGALKWFDMGDLAALIAPRKLIIFNGKYDEIFPIEGVVKQYETVKAIYHAENSPQNCKLHITESAHFFSHIQVWEEINAVSRQLGWR